MPTTVRQLTDQTSVTVAAGDTLVLLCPIRRGAGDGYPIINLAVFPQGAASVVVESSLSPGAKIQNNPDDPAINWFPWSNGAITSGSATKDDSITGNITALRVKPTSGAAIVEARC